MTKINVIHQVFCENYTQLFSVVMTKIDIIHQVLSVAMAKITTAPQSGVIARL